MDTVHLTVSGKDFYVPRHILRKSNYFRGLLEIKDDDLEVLNITPLIFENIIAILSDNINIAKEIAIACDYLEIDDKLEFVNYYCINKECNRISLDGDYCVIHKCPIEGCRDTKENNKYCKSHTCMIKDCINFANINKYSNYCDVHKCIGEGCIRQKQYNNVCDLCKCKTSGCHQQKLPYYYIEDRGYKPDVCGLHKCIIINCDKQRISYNYCFLHTCIITGCENKSLYYLAYRERGFCAQHKCENSNCVHPKEYSKSGFDNILTNDKYCSTCKWIDKANSLKTLTQKIFTQNA